MRWIADSKFQGCMKHICRNVCMNQNIDVVILDVKMPGMKGIEPLEKIRRSFPFIEVVYMEN